MLIEKFLSYLVSAVGGGYVDGSTCKTAAYLLVLNGSVQLAHIDAIAIERRIFFCKPYHYVRLTKNLNVAIAITLTWTIPGICVVIQASTSKNFFNAGSAESGELDRDMVCVPESINQGGMLIIPTISLLISILVTTTCVLLCLFNIPAFVDPALLRNSTGPARTSFSTAFSKAVSKKLRMVLLLSGCLWLTNIPTCLLRLISVSSQENNTVLALTMKLGNLVAHLGNLMFAVIVYKTHPRLKTAVKKLFGLNVHFEDPVSPCSVGNGRPATTNLSTICSTVL